MTRVETATQTKAAKDKIETLDSDKIETPDVEEIETRDVEEVADVTATVVPPCTWVECDDETMEKVILSLNEKALHRVELLEKVRNPCFAVKARTPRNNTKLCNFEHPMKSVLRAQKIPHCENIFEPLPFFRVLVMTPF